MIGPKKNQLRTVRGATAINGMAGYQVTNYAAGGSFRQLLDSDASGLPPYERWLNRSSFALQAVFGTHGNACGVRVPTARIIESAVVENVNDMAAMRQVFEGQDAGSVLFDTDNGGTDDTVAKVPDMAIFLP